MLVFHVTLVVLFICQQSGYIALTNFLLHLVKWS